MLYNAMQPASVGIKSLCVINWSSGNKIIGALHFTEASCRERGVVSGGDILDILMMTINMARSWDLQFTASQQCWIVRQSLLVMTGMCLKISEYLQFTIFACILSQIIPFHAY